MSPNAGGGCGFQASANEPRNTGAQINFGDLTPYLTYPDDKLGQRENNWTIEMRRTRNLSQVLKVGGYKEMSSFVADQ